MKTINEFLSDMKKEGIKIIIEDMVHIKVENKNLSKVVDYLNKNDMNLFIKEI